MEYSWSIYVPLGVYLILLTYILVRIYLGKESSTAETYALGSKSYKRRIVFFTLAATMIGPTYSIGVVEQASYYGFFYTLFFLLAMVQLGIVGYFFAGRIQLEATQSRTVGDIMGKYYNKLAKGFTGVATLGQALAFTGVLCLGSAMILEAIWGLPIVYGVTFTALVVATYSIIGGMPAVLKTDKIQFYFLLSIAFLGVASVIKLLMVDGFGVDVEQIWKYNVNDFPPEKILSVALAFLLGEAFIPVYTVRGLLSKSAFVARKGFIYAAIFGVIWFLVLSIFGIMSNLMPGQRTTGIILLDVIHQITENWFLSSFIIGIAITGILGIIMSTMDSVLNAGAVSFSRDLLKPVMRISEKEEFMYDKVALLFIAVLGSTFALISDNLVDILLIGYTIWVPSVVFPFAYCLVKKKDIKFRWSAVIGMLGGLIGYIMFAHLDFPIVPPILGGLVLNIVFFMSSEYRGVTRNLL